jgi:hypothetical protein
MEEIVPFASNDYFVMLALLLVGRGLDLLSTRLATPNLILEANPIARKLGWKWGSLFNLGICAGVALWPIAAIVFVTTSVLVAARNFKSAWIMRAMGENGYRYWVSDLLAQTGLRMFLISLFGETLLTALVGGAVMFFAGESTVLLAIGTGIVGYAAAVLFYTLLALRKFAGKAS